MKLWRRTGTFGVLVALVACGGTRDPGTEDAAIAQADATPDGGTDSQPDVQATADGTATADMASPGDTTSPADAAGDALPAPDTAAPDTAAPDTTEDAQADVPIGKGPLPGCDVGPTLSSLQEHYFGASCAFSSCHGSKTKKGGLDLSAGKSWASLVNVKPSDFQASQAGLLRVKPGDPDASYVMHRVVGIDGFMPPGETEPFDADCGIQALRLWIEAGALDD